MKSLLLYFVVLFICGINLFSADIDFFEKPVSLQFYARNANNIGLIPIIGKVNNSAYDSIIIKVYRNNSIYNTSGYKLTFINNVANFNLSESINSELAEYKIQVYLNSQLQYQADSLVAGDVYLINGQSNSHPDGNYNYQNEYWRSFGKHTGYDNYNAADTSWGLANGYGWSNPYFGVGSWGIELQKLITTNFAIPVCILNGGSGGSSIEYNLPVTSNKMDLTSTYGRLLYRATKSKLADKIKAVIWHQGESNTTAAYIYYDYYFNILYTNWKTDYPNINKIYVFQIHQGCGGSNQQEIREIQRNFPLKYSDIRIMSTMNLDGHDGCHYTNAGYNQMASWIYRLIARDFYNSTDTTNIRPPNIIRAYFLDKSNTQIGIDFDENINPQSALNGYELKDYFYLENSLEFVTSVSNANSKSIVLYLGSPSNSTKFTYSPNIYYNNTSVIYQGPWLVNPRGVGALSFFNFNIKPAAKFLVNPASYSFCNPANNVTLNISTQGEVYKLQWQKYNESNNQWVDLPGANTDKLNVVLTDSQTGPGKYRCVAYTQRNILPDYIISGESTIKLYSKPTKVSLQVLNSKEYYCAFDSLTFTINCDGSIKKYYFQKFVNNDFQTLDSIQNINNLNIAYKYFLRPGFSGVYRIVGFSPEECGNNQVISNMTILNINNIEISAKEKNIELCLGKELGISIEIFGEPESVNWFKDGILIDTIANISAKTRYLVVPNADKSKSGNYQCRVIGKGCDLAKAVYSEAIKVTISNEQIITKEFIKSEFNNGENAEISVETIDISKTIFQWYKDGKMIEDAAKYSGFNTSKLIIKNLVNADFYSSYWVISQNLNCKDTSSKFTLKKAGSEIKILKNPLDLEICNGVDTSITVEYITKNCDSLMFNWYKDGKLIENSEIIKESGKLIFKNIQKENSGKYYLEILAQPGKLSAKSNEFLLKVETNPIITYQSKDTLVNLKDTIKLRVDIEDCKTPSFKWFKESIELIGFANNSISIPVLNELSFGKYTCEITNNCGITLSKPIAVKYSDINSISEEINPGLLKVIDKGNAIEVVSNQKISELEILNYLGESIKKIDLIDQNSNFLTIDISKLASGCYFIKINNTKLSKFIKI